MVVVAKMLEQRADAHCGLQSRHLAGHHVSCRVVHEGWLCRLVEERDALEVNVNVVEVHN